MIHTQIEKCGFLADIFLPNFLVNGYPKCGVVGVKPAKKY